MKNALTLLAAAVLGVAVVGCDNKENHSEFDVMTMRKQPRYDTHSTSNFFSDGQGSRPLVDHAVSMDLPEVRPAVTPQLLERGQQRFLIYCNMCHGQDGYGSGLVVQHGFPPPPSFHTDRLRGLDDNYIFGVITNGLGKMPPYADQIPQADRWAIVSYVRALQLSQHATVNNVPAEMVSSLPAPTTQPGAALK